jgi:hypothetical protein
MIENERGVAVVARPDPGEIGAAKENDFRYAFDRPWKGALVA